MTETKGFRVVDLKRPLGNRSFKTFEVLRSQDKQSKTVKNMRGLAPLIVLLNFKWRTVRPTNYCGDTLQNRKMSVLASVSGLVAIPVVYWYVRCRNVLRASAHIIALTPTTLADNVSFGGIQFSQYLDLREWMNVKHFFFVRFFLYCHRRQMGWRRSGNRMQTFAFQVEKLMNYVLCEIGGSYESHYH